MNKNKIIYIVIAIIIVIIAIGAIIFWPKGGAGNSDIILYYSLTCPHCEVVENFITQNNITEKVSFQNKEVSENQDNAIELMTKAQKCSIATDSIGVPFLWDGENSKCIVGEPDITQFFKDKAGIK
ncbi:MAG: hypothetical protein WC244_04875 [Patescibacteria group bacterium]|jgi:glutaredoxin